MTTLQNVSAGTGAITQINENFRSVSPAGMYGYDPRTANLRLRLLGGLFGTTTVADYDSTLTASSGNNYVVYSLSDGAISRATNTTNWNDSANYGRIGIANAGSTTITWTDHRTGPYGTGGGGGGGGGQVNTIVEGTGIEVDATDPVNPEVGLDAASIASLALADSALQSVVAGTDIAVDNTDPNNPIISYTGAGGGMTNPMTTAGDIIYGGSGGTPTRRAIGSAGQVLRTNSGATAPEWANPLQVIGIACSDLVTNLTTGTNKAYFVVPYNFTLVEVQASVGTQQTAGSLLTIDINEAGSTILSTKITIDNNEDSSITAATAPVISDSSLAKGAKITIDIDQVGTAGAKGLIVYLVGYPTP